jgi:hypothetical protein
MLPLHSLLPIVNIRESFEKEMGIKRERLNEKE